MVDRKPVSPTSGCADRVHWQWKFTDFPGARFQESAWTLAHAYNADLEGNIYYRQEKLLHWIERILIFWTRIQYADGSFDEAYPGERSFVAAGFSSLAITETLMEIEEISAEVREKVLRALDKTGGFLASTDETHAFISNHRSGTAAALQRIGKLTNNGRYSKRGEELVESVLEKQHLDEGWYLEYTGADPGYQTQGTFYLALYWKLSRDPALLESLSRSLEFLENFVFADGTLGVEIGSRNTEFVFPGGFEILAGEVPDAERIARRVSSAVETRLCPGPYSMDPYNILPITNSFFVAASSSRNAPVAPDQPTYGDFAFNDAGLIVKRNEHYHAVLNIRKGGALRVTSQNGGISREEPGWSAELEDGRIASSQAEPVDKSISDDGRDFTMVTPFREAVVTTMNPWLFIGFRLFSLTVGNVPALARLLKSSLVKKLTRPGKAAPLELKRTVRFDAGDIRVIDEVTCKTSVRRIVRGGPICTIHMGSSQYFEPRSLEDKIKEFSGSELPLKGKGAITEERLFSFERGTSRAGAVPPDEP